MDDLQFYVHFNSISAISGPWAGDIKRLCAMEPRLLVILKAVLNGTSFTEERKQPSDCFHPSRHMML